ncbi:MAG: DUF4403 family protein [Crocinitomicaceae bacterium]|nr:DUF4403 family protein [Crocinitomicaceae bacterium]
MKLLTHYKAFVGLLFFASLGCKSINVPIPEENHQIGSFVKKQELSIIDVPVTVDLDLLFKTINNVVPKKFIGSESLCEGVSFSYVLERNPISYKTKDKSLSLVFNGKYKLNLNYCPKCTYLFDKKGSCITPRIAFSCGENEPMRNVSFSFFTKLNINNNLSLSANTKLTHLDILDPCKVTAFNFDISSRVKKEFELSLKDFAAEINKKISSFDLKGKISSVWNDFSKPIKIKDLGFFYLQPFQFSASEFSYSKNSAKINLSFVSKPSLFTNDTVKVLKKPLPSLTSYLKKDGFNIQLDIKASYDSLSSIINNKISGKKIKIKGRLFRFESCSVSSTINNKILFKIKFSGRKHGFIYLIGSPVFDKEQQVLYFKDVSFSLKTKNHLLKSSSWILSPTICKYIESASILDLQKEFSKIKTVLEKELNNKKVNGFQLKSSINSLSLIEFLAMKKSLFLRLNLTGKLSVFY